MKPKGENGRGGRTAVLLAGALTLASTVGIASTASAASTASTASTASAATTARTATAASTATAPPYSCAPNGPAGNQTIYGTFGDASVLGWTGNTQAVTARLGGS